MPSTNANHFTHSTDPHTQDGNIPNRPNPTNNVLFQEDSDPAESDDDTISDYEVAWLCYRRHYLEEECFILRLGYYFWTALSPAEQRSVRMEFIQAVDDTIKEFAPLRAISRMHQEGWAHITISPDHLHVTRLP